MDFDAEPDALAVAARKEGFYSTMNDKAPDRFIKTNPAAQGGNTMTADRTTKTLLVLIAVALWGLLLRPLLTSAPAYAQSRKVQYALINGGYTDEFIKELNKAATGGWRAKSIAVREGNQIVVLMEK